MGSKSTFELELKLKSPAKFFRDRDIDYIRKKINVNRALNSPTLSAYHQRYYEAAKTLVDLLDYVWCVDGQGYTPSNIAIRIHPGKVSKIESSGVVTLSDSLPIEGEDHPTSNENICTSAKMILLYTGNYDGTDDALLNDYDKKQNGYYKVQLEVLKSEKNNTYEMNSTTLGDIHVSDIVLNYTGKDSLCYPVNPEGVLGYADNFPLPSEFYSQIMETWARLCRWKDI